MVGVAEAPQFKRRSHSDRVRSRNLRNSRNHYAVRHHCFYGQSQLKVARFLVTGFVAGPPPPAMNVLRGQVACVVATLRRP